MRTILHIEASPRGDASTSSAMAAAYLDALGDRLGGIAVDRLQVWGESLPDFDGAALEAKYATLKGAGLTPAQAAAWDGIRALVARIDRADAILVSTPMWNLGIPYKLKQLVDLVTQPGISFAFDPATGYRPLLRDRPVAAVLSSTGDFRDGTSYGRPDLASGYLAAALRFIGLADLSLVPVAPTVGAADAVAAGRQRAVEQIHAVVRRHAEALS